MQLIINVSLAIIVSFIIGSLFFKKKQKMVMEKKKEEESNEAEKYANIVQDTLGVRTKREFLPYEARAILTKRTQKKTKEETKKD